MFSEGNWYKVVSGVVRIIYIFASIMVLWRHLVLAALCSTYVPYPVSRESQLEYDMIVPAHSSFPLASLARLERDGAAPGHKVSSIRNNRSTIPSLALNNINADNIIISAVGDTGIGSIYIITVIGKKGAFICTSSATSFRIGVSDFNTVDQNRIQFNNATSRPLLCNIRVLFVIRWTIHCHLPRTPIAIYRQLDDRRCHDRAAFCFQPVQTLARGAGRFMGGIVRGRKK